MREEECYITSENICFSKFALENIRHHVEFKVDEDRNGRVDIK